MSENKIIDFTVRSNLPAASEAENLMLATELATTYKRQIRYIEKYSKEVTDALPDDPRVEKYTIKDILRIASARIDEGDLEAMLDGQARDVNWSGFHSIMETDPEQALNLWQAIKKAARLHIETGFFSAEAAHHEETPFDRAVYLITRQSFIDEWQPRGGIEQSMIEMLVQSFFNWQRWLDIANRMLETQEAALIEKEEAELDGRKWQPQRITIVEAQDRAILMADRFNRQFLRTLRQLRELRRQPVFISNSGKGQVNVATDGGKQINTQKRARKKKTTKTTTPRTPLRAVGQK